MDPALKHGSDLTGTQTPTTPLTSFANSTTMLIMMTITIIMTQPRSSVTLTPTHSF